MQALLYCMHLMHSYTYNCSTLINHIPGELNIWVVCCKIFFLPPWFCCCSAADGHKHLFAMLLRLSPLCFFFLPIILFRNSRKSSLLFLLAAPIIPLELAHPLNPCVKGVRVERRKVLSLHFCLRSFAVSSLPGEWCASFSLFLHKSKLSIFTENHWRAEAQSEDRANAYTLQFDPLFPELCQFLVTPYYSKIMLGALGASQRALNVRSSLPFPISLLTCRPHAIIQNLNLLSTQNYT